MLSCSQLGHIVRGLSFDVILDVASAVRVTSGLLEPSIFISHFNTTTRLEDQLAGSIFAWSNIDRLSAGTCDYVD